MNTMPHTRVVRPAAHGTWLEHSFTAAQAGFIVAAAAMVLRTLDEILQAFQR